jgi:cytochrome P450
MPSYLATWVFLFLGANSESKNKVISEVQNLVATYSNPNSRDPMHQRLSTIPLSAWEDEMPIIDNVTRETMRLVKNGAALRRSVNDNFRVGDKIIRKGAFLAYHMADVHLNDKFYSEPLKFDPDRFSPPRNEDKQGNFVFLAWGAGRHVCAG